MPQRIDKPLDHLAAAMNDLEYFARLKRSLDDKCRSTSGGTVEIGRERIVQASDALDQLEALAKVVYRPPIKSGDLLDATNELAARLRQALERHGSGQFVSLHEVYGALAEEVDELLEAIRRRHNPQAINELWDCAVVCLLGIVCAREWSMAKEES